MKTQGIVNKERSQEIEKAAKEVARRSAKVASDILAAVLKGRAFIETDGLFEEITPETSLEFLGVETLPQASVDLKHEDEQEPYGDVVEGKVITWSEKPTEWTLDKSGRCTKIAAGFGKESQKSPESEVVARRKEQIDMASIKARLGQISPSAGQKRKSESNTISIKRPKNLM